MRKFKEENFLKNNKIIALSTYSYEYENTRTADFM